MFKYNLSPEEEIIPDELKVVHNVPHGGDSQGNPRGMSGFLENK
jgi:hypothetical protein